MREAAKGYLALAGSLTQVTRQRATAAARALVAQGEATAEQVGTLVEDLLEQTRQNREAVTALVTYEVDRALGRVGLASDGEVAALVDRLRVLEDKVRDLERSTGRASAGGERSAATPEEPARTPPAGRAPARTAAKRTSAKKAPAKKAPAKKAPAKKAPVKKAPAKTAPVKKAPAKKAPAAKAPVKKAPHSKASSDRTDAS
jgi:polyhydroxyalkanoate synthesis regulator phasin